MSRTIHLSVQVECRKSCRTSLTLSTASGTFNIFFIPVKDYFFVQNKLAEFRIPEQQVLPGITEICKCVIRRRGNDTITATLHRSTNYISSLWQFDWSYIFCLRRTGRGTTALTICTEILRYCIKSTHRHILKHNWTQYKLSQIG